MGGKQSYAMRSQEQERNNPTLSEKGKTGDDMDTMISLRKIMNEYK